MDTLYARPGHLVRRAHQVSTALFAHECAAFDLTSVQFAALHAIGRNPLVDATRLSALIACDRSTIGGVLERMQSKGWIKRTPSAQDRRVKLIRLSQAGALLPQRVAPLVQRVQDRLLAPLAEADRACSVRRLSQLTALHGEAAPAPPCSAAED